MDTVPEWAFDNKQWSDAVLHVHVTNVRKPGKPPPRKRGRKGESEPFRTYHVSKLHLALKSQYFRRLIDGWTEGDELQLTVANEEDEETLGELLRFMYTGKTQCTTDEKLFRLLRAADQFDTPSCLEYCAQQLAKPASEMGYSTAVDVLTLPEALGDGCDAMRNLFTAALKKVAEEFCDLDATMRNEGKRERLMSLHKAEFKAVIESDDLRVLHEEVVLLALCEWVSKAYPERQPPPLVVNELAPLVRYPQVSSWYLMDCLQLHQWLYVWNGSSRMITQALVASSPAVRNPNPERDRGAESLQRQLRRDDERKQYKGRQRSAVPKQLLISWELSVSDLRSNVEGTPATEAYRQWSPCVHHCGYRWQLQLSLYGKQFSRKPEKAGQARLFLDRALEVAGRIHSKLSGPMVRYRFSMHQLPQGAEAAWVPCHTSGHVAAFTDDYSKGCMQVFTDNWDGLLTSDNKHVVDGKLHIQATVDVLHDHPLS